MQIKQEVNSGLIQVIPMKHSSTNSSQKSQMGISLLETEILKLAYEQPQLGQAAVAKKLQQEGFQISASGVRYIWQKHGLETTLKRLQSILAKNNGCSDSLTELQNRYLERSLLASQLATIDNSEAEVFANEENGRRSVILNAAAELFSANGYNQTSIRNIAKSAGLLPGSVYHYFSSKETLYLTVHREGLRFVMSQIQAAVDESDEPWHQLESALTIHLNFMVGEATPVSRLTGHNLALTANTHLLEQLRVDRNAYENVIRELILNLPLSENIDRTLLRLMLLGAANWVYVWYKEGKLLPGEIAQKMINMLRYGVSPR